MYLFLYLSVIYDIFFNELYSLLFLYNNYKFLPKAISTPIPCKYLCTGITQ